MNLTDRLKDIIITEPTDDRFKAIDDGGVEIETGELLYAFIRRLKPESILETGCYTGVSALYMGEAVKDNGFGRVWTIEFEPFHITRAKTLWERMGITGEIVAVKEESLKFIPDRDYQFMFLDTELHLRFHELVKFFPYLEEGGFVFIHDMPRGLCQGNVNTDHPDFKNWPVGELPKEFMELINERKLVPFHFGSARGLVAYYKPHSEDYEFISNS